MLESAIADERGQPEPRAISATLAMDPHANRSKRSRLRLRERLRPGHTSALDAVCPPSTVFAAYDAIQAPKEIVVYKFSKHEIPPRQYELRLEHFAREMR
jgi:cephalosporin-C deacetylase-like acetyl esterase